MWNSLAFIWAKQSKNRSFPEVENALNLSFDEEPVSDLTDDSIADFVIDSIVHESSIRDAFETMFVNPLFVGPPLLHVHKAYRRHELGDLRPPLDGHAIDSQ